MPCSSVLKPTGRLVHAVPWLPLPLPQPQPPARRLGLLAGAHTSPSSFLCGACRCHHMQRWRPQAHGVRSLDFPPLPHRSLSQPAGRRHATRTPTTSRRPTNPSCGCAPCQPCHPLPPYPSTHSPAALPWRIVRGVPLAAGDRGPSGRRHGDLQPQLLPRAGRQRLHRCAPSSARRSQSHPTPPEPLPQVR